MEVAYEDEKKRALAQAQVEYTQRQSTMLRFKMSKRISRQRTVRNCS